MNFLRCLLAASKIMPLRKMRRKMKVNTIMSIEPGEAKVSYVQDLQG